MHDEIAYPFSNFSEATLEVWELSSLTPHLIGHVITYPRWYYSKPMLEKWPLVYTHSIRDNKQAVRHVPYSPHTIFCLCLLMVTFLHCDTRYSPCYGFPWYLLNCVQRTGATIWCLGRNYAWAKKLPVWHPLMHTYRYHQIFTRVIRYA